MKIGVVQFPGSNDERDAVWALRLLGAEADLLWHGDADLKGVDAVVLPGGFSYGDYLRCGAIARFSPVMGSVVEFANKGGLVLGICNGFQVLCEAGLLPGALVRNEGLSFVCEPVHVRVENQANPFLNRVAEGQVLTIPIKHGEGRYVADKETLKTMERNGQIVLRYCNAWGEVVDEANPNGSIENIAGVANERGNVFGMMPHPEHAVDATAGIRSADGAWILAALFRRTGGDPLKMFELFNEKARQAVMLAEEEARHLNDDQIRTEHILRALLHQFDPITTAVLERAEISFEALRKEVDTLEPGTGSPQDHIPFSPAGVRCVRLAAWESKQLNHRHVGPEHLLLALVRESETVAGRVLIGNGAELAKARRVVAEVVAALPVRLPPKRKRRRGSRA